MKHISIFLCLIITIVMSPVTASAEIIINEIAWMGTTASANAEWIELYNNSETAIDVTGWKLEATDGTPKIDLNGMIQSDEYVLLERTSDDTVPGIAASHIYSGALGNTGEVFKLTTNTSTVYATYDFSGGWPAGDNITKQTMQWDGKKWLTAEPSPGTLNNEAVEVDESEDDTSNIAVNNSNNSSSSDPSKETSSADKTNTQKEQVTKIEPDPKYTAIMQFADSGVVGAPVTVKAKVTVTGKPDLVSGRFEWYMGDGSAYRHYKNTEINHVFYHPGSYQIVMEYYSNALKDEPDSIHKKTIIIAPDHLSISNITSSGSVVLTNESNRDIDLRDWKLESGDGVGYVLPKYTLIRKNGSLTISGQVSQLSADNLIHLKNPLGTIVSSHKYDMLLE